MENRAAATALACVLCIFLISGCGAGRGGDFARERAEKAYQTAVADYTAGRINEAIEGFEAAVRANPANGSAFFQLAVLLQDAKKDFLGAMCCYRAFLMLSPAGDKASVASRRLGECEKLYAAAVAKKYNLGDSADLVRELEGLREKAAAATKARSAAEAALAEARAKLAADEREKEQLKTMIKKLGDSGEEASTPARPPAKAEPSLLPDPDAEAIPAPRLLPDPEAGNDDAPEKPLATNPQAKALLEEEERETQKRPLSLPPRPAPEEKTAPAGGPAAAAKDGAAHPHGRGSAFADLAKSFMQADDGKEGAKEPASARVHVVQEGETLGAIAQKYYGRKSAWRRIQDANKTIVPPDGKVKAGQTLEIP